MAAVPLIVQFTVSAEPVAPERLTEKLPVFASCSAALESVAVTVTTGSCAIANFGQKTMNRMQTTHDTSVTVRAGQAGRNRCPTLVRVLVVPKTLGRNIPCLPI